MMTPFPQINTRLIDALQVYLDIRITKLPVSDDQKDKLTWYLRDIDSLRATPEDYFDEEELSGIGNQTAITDDEMLLQTFSQNGAGHVMGLLTELIRGELDYPTDEEEYVRNYSVESDAFVFVKVLFIPDNARNENEIYWAIAC